MSGKIYTEIYTHIHIYGIHTYHPLVIILLFDIISWRYTLKNGNGGEDEWK